MTLYRNFISDNFIYSLITDYDIPTLLREHIDEQDLEALAGFVNRIRRFSIVGVIFSSLLTILGVTLSIIITRTITNSVKVLENATKRIAEGELDINVEAKGNNEIISLANSLNKMRHALKEEELRRSRLIMGISHDLKTPLALIKGYAEAIEDGVADSKTKQTEFAEIITTKADHLESMINDLIDFVKMDSGEWREQLKKVNLSVFLQNIVKTLGIDVELLHHELITDIIMPDNIFISLDEKLVYRAIENLIHNAARYTPSGSVIRFTAIPAEKGIEIVVSDNGMGIEKEDLSHVFEMFYRGSSSRREQGMGLGLAVVKWVVDYHGWSISVNSEKGNGTSFTINIPLSPSTQIPRCWAETSKEEY
jgi:signal transduction histidine kinase